MKVRPLFALLLCSLFAMSVGPRAGGQDIAVEVLKPAAIRVELSELPAPYATDSANNQPQVVDVPAAPVLRLPAGFKVNLFAEVDRARWLAVTPNGEVLCASSRGNKVVLLDDKDNDGVAESQQVFVDASRGANQPFGMAFAGDSFYLANTDAVLKYPYDRSAEPGSDAQLGTPETIATLPGQGYNQHWTRNVVVAPGGDKLYVSVGSKTNADAEEPPRASVLEMNLDGSGRRVFASGLRNPVGLDFEPKTGDLFATINERDGLGDNLVPDYLTRVVEGEFYGWPYTYLAAENLDPRHQTDGASTNPELAAKTRSPDVLFQAHSAALGLAFYDHEKFPKEYRGGAFVAFRGSWNRDQGTGYKIVYVPFDDNGNPLGHYQDFLTGFLLDPEVPTTWGRPVGVLVTPTGDLLFTEEAHGRIYRVHYTGGEQ
jgi:glucose/arabinose dehydrogenase